MQFILNGDSENITGYSSDVYFTIFKVTPTINVEVSNVTYLDDVVITIKSDVSGNYVVKVGDNTQDIVLDANIPKVVSFKGLDAGNYSVNVTYAETTNYNGVFSESGVSVFKQASSVMIGDIVNVTVPNSVIIPFTVVNRTAVVINISSEDKDNLSYTLTSDGSVVFGGEAGYYTVVIINRGTDGVEGVL